MSEKPSLEKGGGATETLPRYPLRRRQTWRSIFSAFIIVSTVFYFSSHGFSVNVPCSLGRAAVGNMKHVAAAMDLYGDGGGGGVRGVGLESLEGPVKGVGKEEDGEKKKNKKKVELEVHIMSKCPDARDCLRDLVVPAMANVSEEVDFRLSFIGRINPPTSPSPITCKHGPTECLGNILELCAASLYPSPKTYLGFALCLSLSYAHIPEKELVKQCALEHAVDFERLNTCASEEEGEVGMGLLRESVGRSEEEGVVVSCTVRLNEKVRCVRDGGEWKDCPGGSSVEDLIRDVKKAAKKST